MRRLIRPCALAAFAALLALAGCANAPKRGNASALAAPAGTAPIDVSYPRLLQGFTFISERADSDPAIGTQLGYASQLLNELTLHAFVYLVGFSAEQEPVLADFEQGFVDYLQAAKSQKVFDDFQILDRGRIPIDYPFGRIEGAWQLFKINRAGVESFSLAYLFYRAPFAIKIRATHAENFSSGLLREHVDHFAQQLLPQLTIRNARDCEASVEIPLEEGFTLESMVEALEVGKMQRAQLGCEDFDLLKAKLSANSETTGAEAATDNKDSK